MSIKGYQDLEVWQKAMDLVVMCYQATKNFPKSEVYSLANQLQRAAVSIPANIAEGRERKHKKEFVQHLSIAYSSLAEVETLRAEPVAPFHFTSFARRPSGEFPFTHGQARGTLPFGLLETHIQIAQRLDYISSDTTKRLLEMTGEIGRMLNGLR